LIAQEVPFLLWDQVFSPCICTDSTPHPQILCKTCIVRVLVPFIVFLPPDIVVELVVLMFFIAKGHRSSLNLEAGYPDMFLGVFAKF